MNPYTHLVVASRLAALARPAEPDEYYWGAVAPDMRYVAAMRRRQTHLPTDQVLALFERYPQRESFLQGYLVHCLADQINLVQLFGRRLPLGAFQDRLTHHHCAILLELFCIERRPVRCDLSGTHNEVLDELGLSEQVSARFAQFAGEYARSAYETRRLSVTPIPGLEADDPRITGYVAAIEAFQRRRALKSALFLGVRAGGIFRRIVALTSSRYSRAAQSAAPKN